MLCLGSTIQSLQVPLCLQEREENCRDRQMIIENNHPVFYGMAGSSSGGGEGKNLEIKFACSAPVHSHGYISCPLAETRALVN